MDAAFSASERKWISQKCVTGNREIQFLRRQGSILLKPELEKMYETMATTQTLNTPSEDSVETLKSQIDALGNEFFGAETKKRRRRRKNSECDDDMNVEKGHFEDDDENTADEVPADCNAQYARCFGSGSDNESEDYAESFRSESEEGDAFQMACNEDLEGLSRTFHNHLFMNFGVDVPPEEFGAKVLEYFGDNRDKEEDLTLKCLTWHSVDSLLTSLDTSDGFKKSEPAPKPGPSIVHSETSRKDTTNLSSELDNLPGPSGIKTKPPKPIYTSLPEADDVAGPSRLAGPLRNDELFSESEINNIDLPGPSGIQGRRSLENKNSCTTLSSESEVPTTSSDQLKRCSQKNKESKVKAPRVPVRKGRKLQLEPQRRSLRLQEQQNKLAKSIRIEQTTKEKTQPGKKKGPKKAKNPQTAKRVKNLGSSFEPDGVIASGANDDNQKITVECQGEHSQPNDEPEINSKEKEEQDFRRFFKKHLEKKRKNADPARQNALKTILGFNEDQFKIMAAHIDTNVEDLLGAPVSDDSVAKKTVMPLLAPPIPNVALQTNTALAVFLSSRNRLGNFQWSCKNANEQVTDDLTMSFYERTRIRPEKGIGCRPYNMDFLSDAIFTVLFYHKSPKNDSATQIKDPALAVMIEALGSQTLEELRQHFYCPVDLIQDQIQGDALPDFTIDPCATAKIRKEKMNKPCGLFIDKTMYTNKASREDSRYNYSKKLLEWGRRDRKNFHPGPFNRGDLEETSLIDLTFKCGFPYLFVHEGDCEHLVVIENVRLPNVTDLCHKLEYPMVLESNFKTTLCCIDNKRIARYAVRKMKDFPQDPMLLCAGCLESRCYLNGTKVSDFQLYPYLQLSFLF